MTDYPDWLSDLHTFASDPERALTRDEFEKVSSYPVEKVETELDWPWEKIVNTIRAIRSIGSEDHPPSVREYGQLVHRNKNLYDEPVIYPHAQTIIDHFGKWSYAKYASGYDDAHQDNVSLEQRCLNALREAVEMVGEGNLTARTYQSLGISPSFTSIVTEFGSWNNAKRELNLPVNEDQQYTEEECLQALDAADRALNGKLTITQYGNHFTNPSFRTITSKFGNWPTAMERLEQWREEKDTHPSDEKDRASSPSGQHTPKPLD